jgi:transposase
VAELESRLAKNSCNSSKPPSSEGLKKPKSLRKPGEHPSGGQPGPVGKTLEKVAPADRTVPHLPPTDCDVCGGTLGPAKLAETRQRFDLPPLRYEVTEHPVWEARCACGKLHRGEFPEAVSAPVQYGPAAPFVTSGQAWRRWFI